jgi:hypothetical protein
LQWELPKGWEEKTGEKMRAGSFRIEGEDGKFAEVRIIPLRGAPDIEGQTVNMWRSELGLAEMPANEIKPSEVEAGGSKAHLYDLTSADQRFLGKFKARTTAVILPRQGTLWFIKMSGEESIVTREQEPFRSFLKSLSFQEPEAAVAAAPEAAEPSTADWKIPAGWKTQPPGQMVLAAYQAAKDGATADITVTAFPGDVGGLLANVNRWRGQVGLAPLQAGDLAKEVKTIELASGAKASVVDVSGTNPRSGKAARLYGLIVPRGDKTWFYKMLGASDVVAAETGRLAEFAATAQ